MEDKSCPFCSDHINDAVFSESEHFRLIYNKAPVVEGHSLLIPKRHTPSLLDFTDAELQEFIRIAKSITRNLMQVFNANAFNWAIQENSAAGQTVDHMHLHIIPRKNNDLPEPGDWYPVMLKSYDASIVDDADRKILTQEEIASMAKYLKTTLKKLK